VLSKRLRFCDKGKGCLVSFCASSCLRYSLIITIAIVTSVQAMQRLPSVVSNRASRAPISPCVSASQSIPDRKDSVVVPPHAQTESAKREVAAQKMFVSFKKAAALGDIEAQNALGECYEFGQGVAKDEKKAVACYLAATCKEKLASARAQCNLARCMLAGRGGLVIAVGPAFMLLRSASSVGDAEAMVMLAYCCHHKLGLYDLSEESVKKAELESLNLCQMARQINGEAYVTKLFATLERQRFCRFLQKCASCSEDFININGTRRTDYVELSDGSLMHKACVKEPST